MNKNNYNKMWGNGYFYKLLFSKTVRHSEYLIHC